MKKILSYLAIYFFCSCLNRTEELRKVRENAILCTLISESISGESRSNQTVGNLVCLTQARERIQKINKEDYFGLDDY